MSKSTQGRRSRRRGTGFEREVVRFLKSCGFYAERCLQFQSSRYKKKQEPDIEATLRQKVSIECKSSSSWSLAAYKNALKQAKILPDALPLVVVREFGCKSIKLQCELKTLHKLIETFPKLKESEVTVTVEQFRPFLEELSNQLTEDEKWQESKEHLSKAKK